MSAHPYRIGKDDRIVMRGEEYRMASKNAVGWIFEQVDRPDQRLGLTVAEFETEMLDRKFRLDPGALAKGQDAARMAASARDLGEFPPEDVRGVLLRLRYVTRFLDLERRSRPQRLGRCDGRRGFSDPSRPGWRPDRKRRSGL